MSLVKLLEWFFFSSRRRHTRYWRDWSSDVCSSDLDERGRPLPRAEWPQRRAAAGEAFRMQFLHTPADGARRRFEANARPIHHDGQEGGRSEERRVGKECRSRWSPCPSKTKT